MSYEYLISVIIPAYNSSATIERAIKSVQAQTEKDLEILVIDDASSDDTLDKLRALQRMDERIRILRNKANSGSPAIPRNKGIQASKGRYLSFLDSDDYWAEAKLARQLGLMRKQDAAISCTGYEVKDFNDVRVGSFCPPVTTTYVDLLRHNTLGCSTVMIDSMKFPKIQFPVCGHEDYALWLSLSRSGIIVYGEQSLLSTYSLTEGSVSSNKLKLGKFFWNIYRNKELFSIPYSLYCCVRYVLNVRHKYRE